MVVKVVGGSLVVVVLYIVGRLGNAPTLAASMLLTLLPR